MSLEDFWKYDGGIVRILTEFEVLLHDNRGIRPLVPQPGRLVIGHRIVRTVREVIVALSQSHIGGFEGSDDGIRIGGTSVFDSCRHDINAVIGGQGITWRRPVELLPVGIIDVLGDFVVVIGSETYAQIGAVVSIGSMERES